MKHLERASFPLYASTGFYDQGAKGVTWCGLSLLKDEVVAAWSGGSTDPGACLQCRRMMVLSQSMKQPEIDYSHIDRAVADGVATAIERVMLSSVVSFKKRRWWQR